MDQLECLCSRAKTEHSAEYRLGLFTISIGISSSLADEQHTAAGPLINRSGAERFAIAEARGKFATLDQYCGSKPVSYQYSGWLAGSRVATAAAAAAATAPLAEWPASGWRRRSLLK